MLRAREAVRRMKEYHPPLSGRTGLRLDFNENTGVPSPRVSEVLRRFAAAELTRYPERAPAEAALAAYLGVDPGQVLLTNGVDEAIHLVCETYLEPGDEVLIAVPTFSMYEIYAQSTGASVVTVKADASAGFAFPAEAMLGAITARTRMIAVANPNNPTGTLASKRDLLRLAEAAPLAAVLIDEAYFHFSGETLIPELGEHPNLFIARTFSKAYGMAGLRVGALIGCAEQMRMLRKVSSPYNVNAVALACLPEALSDEQFVADYSRQVRASRASLETWLESRNVPFWPSAANFVLMRIGELHREFVAAMRERGILVRDRSSDPGCDGCVRITLGTAAQTDILLAALPEALAAIGWQPEPSLAVARTSA